MTDVRAAARTRRAVWMQLAARSIKHVTEIHAVADELVELAETAARSSRRSSQSRRPS